MEVNDWKYFNLKNALMQFNQVGFILFENFISNNNTELLELVKLFGTPIEQNATFLKSKIEDKYIYIVEDIKSNETSVISQTNNFFPFHTDGFRSNIIPDYVFLLAVNQSKDGGESNLIRINDVICSLDDETIKYLLYKRHLFSNGISRTILTKSENRYEVAFNPFDILEFDVINRGNLSISALENYLKERQFEYKFYSCLKNSHHNIKFKMKEGDCLIIDNKKILHSRSAFFGNRKFKRVWASCNFRTK